MKKMFVSLLLMLCALGASAQMKVWSNGTVVSEHDTNAVDSISFDSGANASYLLQDAGSTASLEGLTFINNTYQGTEGSNQIHYILYFYSANQGMLVYSSHSSGVPFDDVDEFTYAYNAPNLTITSDGITCTGIVTGQSGLLLRIGKFYYPFLVWK